ncbi:uncharacterized protein isoform X7 [Macaca fascicularis]|uniref:uncharacterized protein isoform X7 n=1 Tax=Macaca fascicularis TaxID=9541 RepID=UPI0032B03329
MADFLRNLLTFKYFRSKDCCSNGAHRERVCKFWSKQEWEADKSSSKSSSLHAPQSRYQELEVALDSSSATINQLNENVESLRIGELEQAPSAVSMQQQEEDRNSENKSALQLEQQVKELQEKQLSEEMKEDIWTLRRRRCLSPCQASWRTWRAGRPWPKQVNCLSPGVRDEPKQHGETLSLQKLQKYLGMVVCVYGFSNSGSEAGGLLEPGRLRLL